MVESYKKYNQMDVEEETTICKCSIFWTTKINLNAVSHVAIWKKRLVSHTVRAVLKVDDNAFAFPP